MSRKSLLAAVAAAALTPLAALAGLVGNYPVKIQTPPGAPSAVTVTGSIASARNSPDSRQYIGCMIAYNAASGKYEGSCHAMDANGNFASCSTTDPKHLAVIAAIGPESFIQWYAPASTSSGVPCTTIIVNNASYYPPAN